MLEALVTPLIQYWAALGRKSGQLHIDITVQAKATSINLHPRRFHKFDPKLRIFSQKTIELL
jgi:hypothetical protein